MSLRFGATTSDKVNVGSASLLDDLPRYTVAMWVYCTTRSNARRLFSKSANSIFRLSGASGDLELYRARGTANTQYITNSTPLALNSWSFLCATFDSGAGAEVYAGSLTGVAARCSYGTATAGSGTLTSDASADLLFSSGTVATSFQGLIHHIGLWNRVLLRSEIIAFQFNPSTVKQSQIGRWNLCGTGTQFDLSGYGNHGVATGASADTLEVPLLTLISRRRYYVPQAAAVAFQPSWARNANSVLQVSR